MPQILVVSLTPLNHSAGAHVSLNRSTYRHVLDFVAADPLSVGKFVTVCVEDDDLVALLNRTLNVRNLSSLMQTVVYYQPVTFTCIIIRCSNTRICTILFKVQTCDRK